MRPLQPWNEANRGNVRERGDNYDSPSAKQSAQYYLALKQACPSCTVVGLDVLDSTDIGATLSYINAFKHDVGKGHMPKIWGLHNYCDTNRFEDNGTKAVLADIPGQLWLTETGGIAKLAPSFPYSLAARRGRRATCSRSPRSSSRITRLYVYSDFGGAAPNGGFDAGLTGKNGQPRPAYCMFYEHVRGTEALPVQDRQAEEAREAQVARPPPTRRARQGPAGRACRPPRTLGFAGHGAPGCRSASSIPTMRSA